MNVLFLTLSNVEDISERGIYSDLIRELNRESINIYVLVQDKDDLSLILS